jgi:hypothetical protein
MNGLGNYLGGLRGAWASSGMFGYLLVGVWLLYPTAFVTVWHPSDAVGFQLWLQGFAVPRYMTPRALYAGEAAALVALGMLSLAQYNIIQVIYSRAGFFVQLWPLATFLVGGIANGVWWLRTGHFDPEGALAGLMPLVAAVVSHGICERGAGNFVFGSDKPEFQGGD